VKANDITDGNDSTILLIFTISGGPLSYQLNKWELAAAPTLIIKVQ